MSKKIYIIEEPYADGTGESPKIYPTAYATFELAYQALQKLNPHTTFTTKWRECWWSNEEDEYCEVMTAENYPYWVHKWTLEEGE